MRSAGAALLLLATTLASPSLGQAERVRSGLTPAKPLRDFAVSRWTTEDGLPTEALTNVLQTGDGYLWISSFDGLVRFDGLEFTVFDKRSVPGFGSNGFYDLVEDAAGTLWIGTQSAGVWIWRDRRFEPVPADGALTLTVRAVLIDAGGTAWIGTGDAGAFRLTDGRWLPVDHPALSGVTVRDVEQVRDGAIWFATEGNGLVRFAEGAFTVTTRRDGLASDAVTSLCEAGDGALWVGTEEGLSRVEGGHVSRVEALAGIEVYRLSRDDYGNLWIAAEQGLMRLNALSGGVEPFEGYRGNPVRSVSAVAFDREGGVWVAGYVDGLFRLKEGKLSSYTVADGLASERINSLHENTAGDVLVGGDGGRISVVRGGGVKELRLDPPLPDVRVRSLLEDRRGRLWVASYAGLLRIEDGRQTWFTADDGLPTNQVRLLYEDRAGRIWIASRNAGLLAANGDGTFSAFDRSGGLASNFVFSIEEGPGGELVVGGFEGLSIVRPGGAVETFGPAEGIPGGIVFSTRVDESGAVWMATNGGLGRLQGGRIGRVTSAEGLPAESVFDLAEDAGGHFWLSSSAGVIRVAKSQAAAVMDGELAAVDAELFDDSDGMAHRSCTGAAKILKTRDGRLWFPTLGGVSVLDPRDVPFNPVPPPVEISRFAVDGEPLNPAAGGHELAPGTREVVFRFAALSLLAPSRVEVRYRLEGFDPGWIDAGAERAVRYTNLGAGDYAFRVVAANNDGVWNERGATVRFRVRPFFYRRPVFLALLAAVAAALIRGVYLWRVRAVRQRNARLERLLVEQRRAQRANLRLIEELEVKNAELERFNYTVSHDLKSPLVTIRGFVGMLERDAAAGDFERVDKDLRRIDSAARTMARLLDELLELSRLGRVVHQPREADLADLAREAVHRLGGEIAAARAEVVVAPDLPTVRVDAPRMVEVFQNLIHNALRFRGDQPSPRVEVGVRRDGDRVVYVRDNGIGVAREYRETIFGLFERLDPQTEGTGIGLALVKRIVEAHGGRVWVESDGLGRGSTFCFTLPEEGSAAPETPAPS